MAVWVGAQGCPRPWQRDTREVVAIKCVNKRSLNRTSVENLLTEIEILKTIRHPNIVELKDFQVGWGLLGGLLSQNYSGLDPSRLPKGVSMGLGASNWANWSRGTCVGGTGWGSTTGAFCLAVGQ